MREIEFRGKTITGIWVYGGISIQSHGTFINDENLPYDDYLVIPETIGQFTGLRDSKRTEEYPEGQRIYEGDALKVTNPMGDEDSMCIVIYDEKAGGYPYEPEGGYGDYDVSTIGWAMDVGYKFEVISDVYDNPALLETVE
ncbi:hypothetical protein D2Q93_04165 [Alicyclobacillaceae bacterium I2511]|nr:hypothetical protein D2Q93_04165 [Alicyclobacillaceae bacterium I2511]